MIVERITAIQNTIQRAQKRSALAASEIVLVAACKSQPIEVLKEAIAAGVTHFGENRVQEGIGHWREIKVLYSHVILHLIGHLQRNKAAEAVALFDVIETLDSVKLIETLAQEMRKQERFLPCFIQVNTGEEPQKAGVLPKDIEVLVQACRTEGIPLVGLMCVPPADMPPAPHFSLLRKLAERYGLTQLSMGMSEDFETAIRLGATHIRIGRALFGERS